MGFATEGWAPLVARHGGGLIRFGAGLDDVARVAQGRMVYLASPYSKRAVDAVGAWDRWKADAAAQEAARVAARLLRQGVTATSPIVQAQAMVVDSFWGSEWIDPMDAGLWSAWCAPMLAASAVVYVPALAGWAESRGILHEAREAVMACKPVLIEAESLTQVAA